MDPLEIYDVEHFFNEFIRIAYKSGVQEREKYFNKFDLKSKDKFHKIFDKKNRYLLSSIKKEKESYELTIINEKKLFEYFFVKFFVKRAIHKLYVKKLKGELKIIRFS